VEEEEEDEKEEEEEDEKEEEEEGRRGREQERISGSDAPWEGYVQSRRRGKVASGRARWTCGRRCRG
jgi:hypothetical protein